MVNKITRKAILDANKNYEAYTKERDVIKEKIATIDEKYRKLAEKEAKELKESFDALGKEQEVWSSVLSFYSEDVVNEVLGNGASSTEEPEPAVESTSTVEEEKVADTLFEENNTVEDIPEDESVQTDSEEESEEFESDSTEEVKEETPVEDWPKEEVPVEDWPKEAEEETKEGATVEPVEEGVSESTLDTNEGWPAMPEEWK